MFRVLTLMFLSLITAGYSARASEAAANQEVRQFLTSHCVSCHNQEKSGGGLDFANIKLDLSDTEQAGIWITVLEQLGNATMPPLEAERVPSIEAIERFTYVLTSALPTGTVDTDDTKSAHELVIGHIQKNSSSLIAFGLLCAWGGILFLQSQNGQTMSPLVSVFVIILLGAYQFSERGLRKEIYSHFLSADIHYATFHDFGYPPEPARPSIKPRLSGVYYRGNDERNPRLFNNGNYRTAKFSVALCDATGKQLDYETDIDGKNLFVKFRIDRPANTPDYLYMPSVMNEMYLTQECDPFLGRFHPVEDRVPLETIEKMQAWEAVFPIGGIQQDLLEGTIYVCEERRYQNGEASQEGEVGGARMHYAISYRLSRDSGHFADDSEIYLGALYRTRKVSKWKLPLSEWFSHESIPELPDGTEVHDIKLLGIDDHIRSTL